MYYYVLTSLLLIQSVEPFSSCDRHKWNAANNMFNSLANDLMTLDKKVQDTCKQFPTFASREIFGMNGYRLEILLPGFQEATFVVRIKHRLIYINAHYIRAGKLCDLTYVDIKILPEFVNTHAGAWTYDGSNLKVAFPYAHIIGDYSSTCSSSYIDGTLIMPHRAFPNDKMFSDV